MSPLAIFDTILAQWLEYRVETIVWDLDCTLGDCPGWDGVVPVREYVKEYDTVSGLLLDLKRRYNVRHVLVSNNGMFCNETYEGAAGEFAALGFDEIVPCNRLEDSSRSKIARLATHPGRTLLIDDQLHEVRKAVRDGGHAIHVMTDVLTALRTRQFQAHLAPDDDDEVYDNTMAETGLMSVGGFS